MPRPALTVLLLLLLPLATAAQEEPEDPLATRVADLVRDLSADDYATRATAVRELESMGTRTRPYLEAYIDSPDPEVARLVEQLIAGFAHRERDDLLVPLDRQDDTFPASEEMTRIVARGRPILPDLWRVVDEEDSHYPSYSYWRMKNAYAAIGRIADTRDLDTLLARLDHPNIQHRLLIRPILDTFEKGLVRKRAKALLGDVKAPGQARAWLLDLCRDANYLRDDPEFGTLARKMLDDPSPIVRVAACRWFWLRRDESARDRLVKAATDEDEEVRAAALRSLRSYEGKNVAATLRNALRDPVPTVRAAAIDTLRSTAGPDMAPLLRPFLKDPDPVVRSNAAQTLARLGDKGAVPVLIELLAERDDEFLMRALHSVVSAVGTLGDPSALPALRKLLSDSAKYSRIEGYRYMILSSIVSIGGEKVLDEIAPYLADPKVQNRHITLGAVARLDSPKVIPILMEVLKNGDARLRTSAVQGLARMSHAPAAPIIRKTLGEEDDGWYLSEAVKALTTFGDEEAVDDIRKLLARDPADNRNLSLFYALIKAVVRFGIEDAAPRVAEVAVSDSRFGYVGVEALGRLGNADVLPALANLHAEEENDSRRHQVALAMARLGERGPLEARIEKLGTPQGNGALSMFAEAYLALGRQEDAKKLTEEILETADGSRGYLYNAGCYLAVLGEIDRAFEVLTRALEIRILTREHLATDPDLAFLRKDPRFRKLLKLGR